MCKRMSHPIPRIKVLLQIAALILFVGCVISTEAHAHTSEGGFVLLLPTDMYIAAGILAVALTVILLVVLPDDVAVRAFEPGRFVLRRKLFKRIARWALLVLQTLSFVALVWLTYIGLTGPRDPLANPLPLTIWTLGWGAFLFLQGVLGDLWRWIDPWRIPVAITHWCAGLRRPLRYPVWIGHWLGVVSFLAFMGFLLADPAPSDPARLAKIVALYWLINFVGRVAFGRCWAQRADGLTMMLSLYGRIGVFGGRRDHLVMGLFGWRILKGRALPLGLAVFCLLILGSGIFDGLNETFWWLAQIGINPLAFPGRSAVIGETLVGLAISNIVLIGLFVAALWAGLKIGRIEMPLTRAVGLFAPTVLPIALGYHFAHYFTSFLVEAQYALAAATDPWATGRDYLGLGTFYVSTGFFNTQDSVRILWLCQAGGVVSGHVVALMLSHAVAVRHFGARAMLSQLPLVAFMIGCTFIGLWLLASPRGF
ncbi:hypothetical protein SAMN04488037_102219 [Shimia marina]|uniref:Fenitrothion hydrolase n=2 Tax=Shimia marina TaxID=321267 RepID=A0A0P1ET71_9RHOB|nr:hypothetical protein SHM7688_03051 [Shimia marina]SFD73259.1 hypothetical protein SAMN04488037_102219 [Shimia marina]